jgi:uncharacterized membrane protein YdjX (TVP38/TMEM64 family)
MSRCREWLHRVLSAGGNVRPWRAGAFLLILLAVALLAQSPVARDQVVIGLDLAGRYMAEHPILGAVLFVAVSALSAILVFFSSVLLVPVGIHVWGEVGCFLLLWAGWFLGGVTTYFIGRYLGRPMVERLLSRAEIDSYEESIPRGTSFWRALLIQLALPSDVVGYFFGLIRYPQRTYLGSLALAELPYALGTVFLGAAFLERQYALLLAGAAVAAVVLLWQQRARSRSVR